jgi:hypothetical protein
MKHTLQQQLEYTRPPLVECQINPVNPDQVVVQGPNQHKITVTRTNTPLPRKGGKVEHRTLYHTEGTVHETTLDVWQYLKAHGQAKPPTNT